MGADDPTDPQIRQIRRVLYRRRGWAWTGVAGLITTAICAIIVASLAVGLTGFAAVFVFVIVLALVVLTLLAVCLALVDTARLRRAPTAARASAAVGVSHHPWYVLPSGTRRTASAAGIRAVRSWRWWRPQRWSSCPAR